ncbi:MAG: purine catabolism regulator-like protein [Mycobacterium sp.]|nr:purine catabolism regulator-like protein [Mycobacterium sp.]
MAYRVSDLVDTPHLRLKVRAGAGGLDKPVAWAQTSDLEEPWSFLAGGELLMKNGQTLPEASRGQTALIRGLVDNGIRGLVIGLDAATPDLTPAATTLADDLDFPVMTVPYSVGFAAIGRAVADAAGGAGRVAVTERVYNVIRQSVTHRRPDNVLTQLGRDLSCRLAVLDPTTGDVALDASDPLPTELRRVVVQEIADRRGAVPGVLHVSAGSSRGLVVEVPDAEPTVLVAYDFRSSPTDLVPLQHLASAVAVLLAQQNARREHDRRIGAEVMAQLCDGRMGPAEADSRLAERMLRAEECSIVAAGGASATGERQLHLSLGRRGVPHLLLRRGPLLYALMPVTDVSLAALQHRLGHQSTIGISDPLAQPGRAPTAVREATWAVRVAETASERIARYADATMLSVLRDTEEAQIVVDRVLGQLINYDTTHSTEMVKTLDRYLQCSRSWVQTAARLGVHRQTVVYRIQRIEQITGRKITDTATIAEFWLALRAKDLLTVPS